MPSPQEINPRSSAQYPLRPRRRPLGFGLGFDFGLGLGLLLDLPLAPHDLQPQPCIEE